MIEKYLMTFDEYNTRRHPIPYSYSIQKQDQHLFYFGSKHSYDPEHPQFETIKKFWKEFLNKTQKKNCISFIEGGTRPVESSEEKAILKYCEMGFVTYLSAQENIDRFSPEPPEKFKFKESLKKFTKEEIVYYEFARMAHQWNLIKEKPDFDKYVGDSLIADQENSGWGDFDFSINHMIEIEKKMFGREFDKNDQDFYYKIINPTTTFSRINEISRFEDSGFRDGYILGQIEKSWNEGKNIFIVYGCSHAVMHEKAIRKLTE